ncbi:MerR family transcriptional regulator [Kitasatospora sp. NPDC036755]|uniref:MerR family transcriptional regulator n=1 Tax=Kitasatospora sp. NPDC036755 TaxID=3154600 RepID=UPI0033E6743D
MRIGELARRAGVTPRALRYYEEQGLLAPERRPSGYREYDERDVDTVRGIRTLLAAGLNSAAVGEVLRGLPLPGQRRPGPTCPELLAGLAEERARITRRMNELAGARALLDAVMGAEAPGDAIRSGSLGAGAPEGDRETERGVEGQGARGPVAGSAPAGARRPRAVARKLDGARSRAVLE